MCVYDTEANRLMTIFKHGFLAWCHFSWSLRNTLFLIEYCTSIIRISFAMIYYYFFYFYIYIETDLRNSGGYRTTGATLPQFKNSFDKIQSEIESVPKWIVFKLCNHLCYPKLIIFSHLVKSQPDTRHWGVMAI